jgi:hypothetical protein
MVRRTIVISVLVLLASAAAAVPAVALLRGPVDSAARASAATAAGTAITFDASPRRVRYGQVVIVAGQLSGDVTPLAGSTVTLRETRGDVTRDRGTATTDGDGFYTTVITPRSNASWAASAAGVSSAQVLIRVMPRVTLALSHLTPRGTRLREVFTGAVRPALAGRRVRIQKAVGSGWRTVASGRLDRRSRYRVVWSVPFRTAKYKLRAVLPASADYARGTSPRAILRVVVGRR